MATRRKELPSVRFQAGRFLRPPSRAKQPSRKERQLKEILDIAQPIFDEMDSEERQGFPEPPQKLSRWGLPANITHSFNNFPPAIQKLIERHNALIDLKSDARDALAEGLIDKATFQREAKRLDPLIEEAGEAVRRARREESTKQPLRRGARPAPHKHPRKKR